MGLDLHRVFLAEVAQRHDVGVAKERVIVEVELRVEAEQLTGLGHDQRIDLQEAHVLVGERQDETAEQHAHLLLHRVLQPERQRNQPDVKGKIPVTGSTEMVTISSGRPTRHLLDIQPPPRDITGDARSCAIDQHREVELAVDGDASSTCSRLTCFPRGPV